MPAPAPASDPTKDPLPAAIGGKALVTAATAGDPAASYEVASRFAEGKGVPQDLAMAAAWFDRAARRGIAPAQFRLGSMYEKGVGLKKDVQEARRLYLAAADKGNAKAMHNLAVLYAEGIDGKPEYTVASQWFRKAAAFGIVDSQYNLAIPLCARRRGRARHRRILQMVRARRQGRRQGCRQEVPRGRLPSRRAAIVRRAPKRRGVRPGSPA